MNYQYITFKNQHNLIEGVVLRKLVINKDESGSLVETLRKDWNDVFDSQNLPFAMQYLSITPQGVARDEDKWHVHKNQEDRFICVSGRIVTAVFDPRVESQSCGKFNLFVMGPQNEDEMFIIVIPQKTYHGFMVISTEPGYLINFPTRLYNP